MILSDGRRCASFSGARDKEISVVIRRLVDEEVGIHIADPNLFGIEAQLLYQKTFDSYLSIKKLILVTIFRSF